MKQWIFGENEHSKRNLGGIVCIAVVISGGIGVYVAMEIASYVKSPGWGKLLGALAAGAAAFVIACCIIIPLKKIADDDAKKQSSKVGEA